MSDALARFQPGNLQEAEHLSQVLAKSALLPDALRNKPGDVLVLLITGAELGLSAMQAIRGLYVVKGKAVMSADMTVALVKKHAECVKFRLVETTDAKATYETERKGEGKTVMSFTIEQAAKAGLTGGDNWRKYPAAMLRARCAAALARAVYPDLTLGVYDPDELVVPLDAANETVERDVTPPPPLAEQVAATAPKPSRTETLKGVLRERKPLAAKTSQLIIDVKPGQTEAEAEAAHKAAKPKTESPHYEAILELGKAYGKTTKQLASIIKGATGKERPSQLDADDVGRVHDALAVIKAEEDKLKAEEPPPHTDDDVPFGE